MPYQSAHTGAAIDSAIQAVIDKNKTWDDKQEKLTGLPGQFLTFDEDGNPVAQDMSTLDIDNALKVEGGANAEIDPAVFGDAPYVISFTPDEDSGVEADLIEYDGSASGLSATNVQDAIDEVLGKIGSDGGASGGSGIAIGPDEPSGTDVWIDTDDDGDGAYGVVMSFNGRDGDVEPQAGDYTAEMVGAISTDDKGAAGGVATLGVDGKLLDAQIPSLAKLGAAPAGYGYGEKVVAIKVTGDADGTLFDSKLDELLETLANGWAQQISFEDYPYLSGSTFYGTLFRHTKDYSMLVGVSYGAKDCIVVKRKFGGVWEPFEEQSPSLTLGTEYRTTERYMGKPVYTMLVDCGAVGVGTASQRATTYKYGISPGATAIKDFRFMIRRTETNGYITQKKIPAFNDDTCALICNAACALAPAGTGTYDGLYAVIQSYADLSSYTAYLLVEYTKD